MRQLLTYKAEAHGITVALVPEYHSTQTCPNPSCNHCHTPTGRVYRCPVCGLQAHRDAVGSVNLLSQYLHHRVGKILPPSATTYRIPYTVRVLRSRPDTGQPVFREQAVACGQPQEAAGL
jgi:transposase